MKIWAVLGSVLLFTALSAPVFGQTTAKGWIDKGIIVGSQGKYDEALEAFNKAIEMNPQDASAWIGKGISLEGQGKCDDAVLSYNKAIEINPHYTIAWYNKGISLFVQSEYNKSIKCFNEAIELDPKLWLPGIIRALPSMNLANTVKP